MIDKDTFIAMVFIHPAADLRGMMMEAADPLAGRLDDAGHALQIDGPEGVAAQYATRPVLLLPHIACEEKSSM
jgi:hypothetical protein